MAQRGDLHAFGITPLTGRVGLEVPVGLRCRLKSRVAGKDEFTPSCGEAASSATLSGLNDNGVALLRARHGEGAARAEMSSSVIKAVHLVGIGKAPGGLVDDERVI